MSIQKCKNCSAEFRWRTVYNSYWNGWNGLSKPIECDNCKTKHYLYTVYRIIVGLSIGLPVFFIPVFYSLFKIPLLSVIAYFVWIFIISSLSPLYFKFYTKDED